MAGCCDVHGISLAPGCHLLILLLSFNRVILNLLKDRAGRLDAQLRSRDARRHGKLHRDYFKRPDQSPIINQFDIAIILNQPSMDKFENSVKPMGQIFYESNNVINPPTREDVSVFEVPAVLEAVNMKNAKGMNMITLGAFLKKNPIVSIDSILKALKSTAGETSSFDPS